MIFCEKSMEILFNIFFIFYYKIGALILFTKIDILIYLSSYNIFIYMKTILVLSLIALVFASVPGDGIPGCTGN
jgi:hypothetical protein